MNWIDRQAEKKINQWLTAKQGKILLVLGARQVGKTTLIKTVLSSKKLKYLNLDIEFDKQQFLRSADLDPQSALLSFGNPDILIVDEAQKLPDSGRILKGWFDSGLVVKLIMSGSSSLNLLDQSAESLTGRNIKLNLPPLLFEEILAAKKWGMPPLKKPIESLLMECLVFGSYPEAVLSADKQSYLINLVSDYLLKDVLYSGLVKEPQAIKRLLSLLAYQAGGEVSVNELSGNLGISRITVNRYLDLLERTFVIFRLPAFGSNPRKEITKSQKIYFWDTGVRNALINEFNQDIHRSDIGSLWENWVVAEFAKKNFLNGNINQLYFWRAKTGSEVDLIIKNANGKLFAWEIKWGKAGISRAFSAKYNVPVTVINRNNFTDYLI